MNLVDQNSAGNLFAVSYQDNGQFYVIMFNTEGKQHAKINVNDLLGIDKKSTPISGFYEPLITVAFIPGEKLFVQAYHRLNKMSYHFTFDYKSKTSSNVINT